MVGQGRESRILIRRRFNNALAMTPVGANRALFPFCGVGVRVVVDLKTAGAVFALLESEATGIAKVMDDAVDGAIAPQGRLRDPTIRATIVFV